MRELARIFEIGRQSGGLRNMSRSAFCGLVLAGTTLAFPAYAQTVSAPAPDTAAVGDRDDQETTVTARRRDEDAQRVLMSLLVAIGALLEQSCTVNAQGTIRPTPATPSSRSASNSELILATPSETRT